jgi:hypothetical protein
MFRQFLTACRRLVGGRPAPAPARQQSGEERRVWVRHPSVSQTSVSPLSNAEEVRLSASIRNVSRGGANLVVHRRFTPGDMISVEVPRESAAQSSAVLACVVHAVPLEAGCWSLGCAFSEHLDEDDLEAFVTGSGKSTGCDQRSYPRQPSHVRASFQVVSDPEQNTWTAGVLNLSPGGIALQVEQSVEAGALLSLKLEGRRGQVCTILACVVHLLSHGQSQHQLGCNFIHELSETHFQEMLAG